MSISVKILGALPLPDPVEIEEIDFCYCGVDCYDKYYELAFTAGVNDEEWKKDKSSFLFRKLRASDTIAIEIYKGGTKVADIDDNTYGTYYSTFTAQPLYVGFVADWSLIRAAFGSGYYQIKAQKTILGVSSTFESRQYWCIPFDTEFADNTVRIETFTTGNILRSEFDYDSLIEGGWYQSRRIQGRFGNVSQTLVTDKQQTSDRTVVSVQDKIENEYTLLTEYLSPSVKSQLVNEQLLNNRCLITDYNILNDEVIRQKEVYLNDFSTIEHDQRGTRFELLFKESKDNLILRNF